jgi:hypothetical protein
MEPSNAVLVAGGAFTFFGGMIGGELGLPVVAFLTVLFNGTIERSSSR